MVKRNNSRPSLIFTACLSGAVKSARRQRGEKKCDMRQCGRKLEHDLRQHGRKLEHRAARSQRGKGAVVVFFHFFFFSYTIQY